jgi:peptide/nickel transport system permease protein
MARYIVRRLLTMLLTMLIVSVVVFAVVEIAPGNVARNVLGTFATPEQEKSMENQLGLDRPWFIRYASWLLGSDWQAERVTGFPLRQTVTQMGTVQNAIQWWGVDEDGNLAQWDVEAGHLFKTVRQPDGSLLEVLDDGSWKTDAMGRKIFWGVDDNNRAALWIQGLGKTEYLLTEAGWIETRDGPVDYMPLSKGLVRGDFGTSFQYRRPVNEIIGRKIRNSAILAGMAFLFAMPLGVLLGLIAGLNEGKKVDRVISLGGLVTAASPDFATGIFLIMVFGLWLKLLPGATVFVSDSVLARPKMLVLPVLTASLVEIGYILRITRASVVEVIHSNYVRTAILKGIPYSRVVFRHVLRNSLMAPVTVIMLHVNWLIGGLVVVESVFGYPGLGNFILGAALYKDVYAIEAGAMVLIVLAVGTQLVADIVYSFLNPRIRYGGVGG